VGGGALYGFAEVDRLSPPPTKFGRQPRIPEACPPLQERKTSRAQDRKAERFSTGLTACGLWKRSWAPGMRSASNAGRHKIEEPLRPPVLAHGGFYPRANRAAGG